MRPKHSHTGYGVWDITRQVARRVQQEWEAVESPPRPPLLMLPVCPRPVGRDDATRKTERRPLAA